MASPLVVFGYSAGGTSKAVRNRFAHFSELLGKRSKLDVNLFEASAYDDLTAAIASGYVDVAWLAPIPYVALERRGAAVPLVHLHRGGSSTFQSAIIVRADSRFSAPADLRGARAAWVERHSASGFVVPRIELEKLGVDPRTAFPTQRFFGSHEAVVRAVVGGHADFGATYAGVGADGAITRGSWLGAKEIRVLSVFGQIPGDIVAARAGLAPELRKICLDTLLGISRDRRSRLLASDAFGVEEFRPFISTGYAELGRATEQAAAAGLLNLKDDPDRTGTYAPPRV